MIPKNPGGRSRKLGKGRSGRSSKPPPPEISLEQRPVGRATLNAILREMQEDIPLVRKPFVTIGYDEKPLGDDVSPAESYAPTCIDDANAAPEIIVSETRPGLETMAVIDEELLRDARQALQRQSSETLRSAEVLELLTFVILDKSLPLSASMEERRTFVAERLWHRLPAGGINAVRRIDIRPADETALMMRVWCAVPKLTP
ncbi:MAG: hypothetical protein BWY17_00472 [Deltaproteobacteria bacterium ADurb.Bin207]|nr:MAG: hypothetical protein BWY17_00472 [Deltaproteobacteria bacterium ADurb.Bin207]